MKQLVIVESPTKAKTIGRFLGKDFDIKFSMGHLMDLPKSKLGVDIENDFAPDLEVVEDKKKIIAELRSAAKGAETIILATDPDREGEAIAANIKEILGDKRDRGAKGDKGKFKRIVFHEITEEAIKEAFGHPRDVDQNLVNAQTARRVLDRLVGYKISPILWQKVRRGLSAGRVQSVALRLIVEREKEIEKFKKETYFTVHAMLIQSKASVIASGAKLSQVGDRHVANAPRDDKHSGVEFTLIEINGDKLEVQEKFSLYDGDYTISKTTIKEQKQAEEIVQALKKAKYTVADVIQKETRRFPQAPFITSTLQQEASRRFGYPGKRTMSLAQKLYEEGFITYHRTDSVVLAQSAINSIRGFVQKTFGDRYIPDKLRSYATKQKSAQEAHEGIRPTQFHATDTGQHQEVGQSLGKDCAKLYDLIWRRAIASQMADAIVESTTVMVDAFQNTQKTQHVRKPEGQNISVSDSSESLNHRDFDALSVPSFPKYRFKANGSVLKFDGFLKINPQALQDTRLPQYTAGESLKEEGIRADQHETTPPPRYNDASIIATLEEKSIGRPSTYATIISTLTDRGYVERAERRFIPTSVGVAVNDFLVENFSTIDDIPFTAQMEDNLDMVASGEKEWVTMMQEFYKPFEKSLDGVKDAKRVKIETEKTGEKCPECQKGDVVIRTGKFGKFLSCSRFPDCKFTKPYVEETNITCPKDGGKVIIKKTRKGRKFYGCSNYPKCDFAAWKLEDIKGYKPPKVEEKPAVDSTQSATS